MFNHKPAPVFVPVMLGGPKEGKIIAMIKLPDVLYFTDHEARKILAYIKIEELTYQYEPEFSEKLTADFDYNSRHLG